MSDLVSPLPGYVGAVHVKPGDRVSAGDPIVTLQSMKMEIPVAAESSGTIAEVCVQEGDEIDTGTVIARIA